MYKRYSHRLRVKKTSPKCTARKAGRRLADATGQATVEWIGIVLLVAVLLIGAIAVVNADWLPAKVRCAITGQCTNEDEQRLALDAAYGAANASAVQHNIPDLAFEHGEESLPIDFRDCPEGESMKQCGKADPSADPEFPTTIKDLQGTVFTRVIDQRDQGGDLHIQYWYYYPDSDTKFGVSDNSVPGSVHNDDWESYQIKINSKGEIYGRASAHHGYSGKDNHSLLGKINPYHRLLEKVGRKKDQLKWTPDSLKDDHYKKITEEATRKLWVSRGSHAGMLKGPKGSGRQAKGKGLKVVPIETLPKDALERHFDVTPPWKKEVYKKPGSKGT